MGTASSTIQTLPYPHPVWLPSSREVDSCQSIVTELDHGIEEIETTISQLRTKAQDLQRRRSNYLSYIATIRKLPNEILANIIDLYVEEGEPITTIAQISRRFRDIALSIPSNWSYVWIPAVPNKEGKSYFTNTSYIMKGVQCGNRGYLEMILTRAKSTPLKLQINFPIDSSIFNYLSQQSIPVHTLAVNGSCYLAGHPSVTSPPSFGQLFAAFNMDPLQLLQISYGDSQSNKELLGLALQSNCNDIILEIPHGHQDSRLLEHGIMNRVLGLRIQFAPLTFDAHNRTTIKLPRLKMFRIHDDIDTAGLCVLDLSDVDTLELSSTTFALSPIGRLSSQLTTLTLRRFRIDVKLLIDSQPHFLPNLVTLNLQEIEVDGPLHTFFKCSRLKRLYYQSCAYSVQKSKEHTNRRSRKAIDETFLQQTPLLQHISLQGASLDFALPPRSGHHLRSLIVDDCRIGGFIPTFINSLQEPAFLPSLQLLQIENSWPSGSQMSYQEFVKHCQAKRSTLWIFGNENPKLPFPYLETGSSRPLPYYPDGYNM